MRSASSGAVFWNPFAGPLVGKKGFASLTFMSRPAAAAGGGGGGGGNVLAVLFTGVSARMD
jgi:hypothetical protein